MGLRPEIFARNWTRQVRVESGDQSKILIWSMSVAAMEVVKGAASRPIQAITSAIQSAELVHGKSADSYSASFWLGSSIRRAAKPWAIGPADLDEYVRVLAAPRVRCARHCLITGPRSARRASHRAGTAPNRSWPCPSWRSGQNAAWAKDWSTRCARSPPRSAVA